MIYKFETDLFAVERKGWLLKKNDERFCKIFCEWIKSLAIAIKTPFSPTSSCLEAVYFYKETPLLFSGSDKYFSVIDPCRRDHEPASNFNLYLVLVA